MGDSENAMPVPDHRRAEVIAIDRRIPKATPDPKILRQHDAAPIELDRSPAVLAKILGVMTTKVSLGSHCPSSQKMRQ